MKPFGRSVGTKLFLMKSESLPVLPYDVFGPKLDDLLVFSANKLDREFPTGRYHSYAGPTLVALMLVSANTYRTMRYFCADKPSDPKRRPEYALSAGPLARTILDALFTLLFLLEDLNERVPWFMKCGWREVVEELERARTQHGDDPKWQYYIEGLTEFAEESKHSEFEITPDEEREPKKIPYWPIPNQMIPRVQADDVRRFMEYLRDWFYRQLSQDSHLSWRGLARRAGYLLLDRSPLQKEWDLPKQKSDVLMTTVVLLLAMMSEIELFFGYGAGARLKFVWNVINPYFQQGGEIYDLRYSGKL